MIQIKYNTNSRVVYYEAILSNIIQRIRFPKFLAHTKDKFGNEGELILEELIEHGCLSMEQSVKQATTVTLKRIGSNATGMIFFGDDNLLTNF